MSAIKIRVGASLDSSALTVFEPLVKAGQRARKQIEADLRAAAKATGQVAVASKKSGDSLERELDRMAEKILSDEERSQRARTRVVERESRERARLEEKAAEQVEGAIRRSGGGRGGAIGIGRRAAISVSRGSAIAYGLGGRAISMAAGTADAFLSGVGVETSFAPHAANAIDLQSRVGNIVSAGYIPGAAGAQGVLQNAGDIQKEIYKTADSTAFGGNEIAEGLQKFVGLTGDLETGRKTLFETAKLARATGSDFVAMAEASGEVSNHLGNVPNKAEAVSAVMRVVAGQGKMGALEIKDFARQMAKIAANAPMFEGKVSETIGDLALIAQESKMGGGSASASNAATSVAAFANDLTKKTTMKHWQQAGINPFTDASHTKLRSPEELILEAISYTKGDQGKLGQLLPSSIGRRAVKPFAAIYSETYGDEKTKLAAVAAEFDRMRAASLTTAEVSRAFAAAMDTGKSKVQIANNKLDELAATLTTSLLPAVAALAPAIEAMTPAMESAIGQLAHLLGLHPEETEAEQKRRVMANQREAMQTELDKAKDVKESVVAGKDGAELKIGEVDQAHVDAIEKRKADIATELEALSATHAKRLAERQKNHGALELSNKDVEEGWGWGLMGANFSSKERIDKKMGDEELHINELKIEANRTNALLSEIKMALTTGQVRMTVTNPTPAPRSDNGTMPGDSPDPQ